MLECAAMQPRIPANDLDFYQAAADRERNGVLARYGFQFAAGICQMHRDGRWSNSNFLGDAVV